MLGILGFSFEKRFKSQVDICLIFYGNKSYAFKNFIRKNPLSRGSLVTLLNHKSMLLYPSIIVNERLL